MLKAQGFINVKQTADILGKFLKVCDDYTKLIVLRNSQELKLSSDDFTASIKLPEKIFSSDDYLVSIDVKNLKSLYRNLTKRTEEIAPIFIDVENYRLYVGVYGENDFSMYVGIIPISLIN